MNIDAWQAQLHDAGWSIGDMTVYTPAGLAWMVYGCRGEQRIIAKAAKQADAWREAAKMLERIGEHEPET